MRIISGSHKGRRIFAPKNLPVRPTTDMAKEALFNILNNQYYFADLKILDLFSGTGNIAFEFASRGAKEITCVDSHQGCVQFISKTSEELDLGILAMRNDVFTYLGRTKDQFDLIFADPPYDMSLEDFEKISNLVFQNNLLKKEGSLIIEHSKQMDLSHLSGFKEQRKYGGSVFSFFSITGNGD
ncbi:RsmD family RNA methyltransferase [Maribacter halichondriae]|uniref:RsmD family RNA methyltransferase n=1 Tax=Maribacter halichondriae TaxID=2980554 RepID=UPI0023581844|nr:RsmD family RNA methyltransferase [Maribacter sp. Hal144]